MTFVAISKSQGEIETYFYSIKFGIFSDFQCTNFHHKKGPHLEVAHAQHEELAVAYGLADVVVLGLQLEGLLRRPAALPVQRGVDDVDEVAQLELTRVRLQLAREVDARGGDQLEFGNTYTVNLAKIKFDG